MKLDERFRRSVPWRLPDLYLAIGLGSTGVVVVGVARAAAAGRDRLADQIPWVNLAVGGLVAICLGCALWVLAGLRATAELRRTVLGQLRVQLDPASTDAEAPSRARSYAGRLVTGPAMTRAHDPGCPLVAGKDVTDVAAGAALPLCGVCLGDAGAP